jgi:hypothetical protein
MGTVLSEPMHNRTLGSRASVHGMGLMRATEHANRPQGP